MRRLSFRSHKGKSGRREESAEDEIPESGMKMSGKDNGKYLVIMKGTKVKS